MKINKREHRQKASSNIDFILTIVNEFLQLFQKNPFLVDKESAQIQSKYPKYLSQFSLFDLQMKDYIFRETFLIQV
jgi:hypothetical protein